jgi:Tfp pilus assembly pilus retraction ATPase PilT
MTAEKRVQGDLASFSIFDITQTLLSGHKTGQVAIESGIHRGFLSFENGQIVSAIDDQLNSGEKAVFGIFSWRRGSFTIDFDACPKEHNVKVPTDSLLLEIARQIDEASRDAPSGAGDDEQVGEAMERNLGAKLKSKLTSIFKHVAEQAEPARDRYTRRAFDRLLGPLLELRGSGLFIRRGLQPRVKTPEGFVTLKDSVLEENEISGFLMATLSEREAAVLREQKEVTTLYDGGPLGAFRVSAFDEEGAPTIVISPARREVPAIADFGLGGSGEALAAITDGVTIVSGPLGSAKADLVAALVSQHVDRRDKFAVVFASDGLHGYAPTRGFIMQRLRPAGAPGLARALRTALDQGADLIAVDAIADADELRAVLEAGAAGRTVVAALDALSFGEALSRLQRMTQDQASERVGRLLADVLRAIVWLPPRRPQEAQVAEALLVGREEGALLRKRDFESLRMRQVVGSVES